MLRLPDSWVWDAWYVRDQDTYHAFFLYASRALHDPDLRHRHASIGHVISTDLRHWERVEDALVHGSAPGFDQLATWTGSVVQGDDQRWYLFYTGVAADDEGRLIQQIGLAVSDDLHTWNRHPANPIISADPRWYETVGGRPDWADEHWRDPWVMRDPLGNGWHMLITARSPIGPWDDRGVIAHVTSPDLISWQVHPPVADAEHFGFLEVPQVETVQGRTVLIFNCNTDRLAPQRAAEGSGGIWYLPDPPPIGPYDLSQARLLAREQLYVGKLIQDPHGDWVMIAFINADDDGAFVGELTDPAPVRWQGDQLVLDHPAGLVAQPDPGLRAIANHA